MPTREDLIAYRDWLLGLLGKGWIPDEKEFSKTVGLPRGVPMQRDTLLQTLGYVGSQVDAEFPIKIATTQVYADFYIGKDESRNKQWVLELKDPKTSCDHPDVARQLQDYLHLTGTPLGVVFNGYEVRGFLNARHAMWNGEELPSSAVESVSTSDASEFADFFAPFQIQRSLPDTKEIATRWFSDYKSRNEATVRLKTIEDRVAQMIQMPTLELAVVIASLFHAALRVTPHEVLAALQKIQGITPSERPAAAMVASNNPIAATKEADLASSENEPQVKGWNPQVRDFVRQVCALPGGYEALVAYKIRGLNMEMGTTVRGYRRVPDGPGVPEGLATQGVDSIKAQYLIAALKALLEEAGREK